MSDYSQVSPNLWNRAFRELRLADPNAQTLYLYLQTCRHRNSEGLFCLPTSYAATDTGMTATEIETAFSTLIDAGYIAYDEEREVLLDRHALRFFQPTGIKQIRGAVRVFQRVHTSSLKVELLRLAYVFAEDFAEALTEACPELVSEALPQVNSANAATDTLSNTMDRVPEDKTVNGYPEVELRARKLKDRGRNEQLDVETSDAAVNRLREKLNAQMTAEGGRRP